MRKITKEKNLTEKAIQRIKNYISMMDLKHNNKLPREELLADIIGVSRVTIRSALNTMASQGIIFRRHGKGTFVNVEYFDHITSINQLMEYSKVIEESGHRPRIEYLKLETAIANEKMADELNIKVGDPYVINNKLFFADDIPCIYCEDRIPVVGFQDDEMKKELKTFNDTIFKFFSKNYHRQLTWDKINIGAVNAAKIEVLHEYYTQEVLYEKSFLVFQVEAYDQKDQLILCATEYIDPQIIRFSSVRQRII